MSNGPFTWFNGALDKIAKNVIRLDTQDVYAVLVGAAQAIDPTFVGASTDCRYADLTAELATANGYTVGGVLLSNRAFSRAAEQVKYTADPIVWTLTNSITYKYLILRMNNTNNDLLAFMDADTTSGAAVATPTAGTLQINPNVNGYIGWKRV
jgi:hypothetical protein